MPVAIVTGAAQGIGQRTAEVLSERGYDPALIDTQSAAETIAHVRGYGRDVFEFTGSVADENAVAKFAAAVRARWGPPDVVVNNAGISLIRPAEQTQAADFRRVLEINLVGPFLIAQAFGAMMLEKGSGSIVNVASIAGLAGIADRTPTTHRSTGSSASRVHWPRNGAGVACAAMPFVPAG